MDERLYVVKLTASELWLAESLVGKYREDREARESSGEFTLIETGDVARNLHGKLWQKYAEIQRGSMRKRGGKRGA